MRERFRDSEHLFRMAGMFAIGFLVFLGLRAVFVPEGFGELGHFRAGAIADNSARAPVFAGRGVCGECHDDIAAARRGGAHEKIGCESCHGALAAHASDPEALQPQLPDPATLCLGCHRIEAARPTGFPQVDAAEHADSEPCLSCHDPHRPGIDDEGGA